MCVCYYDWENTSDIILIVGDNSRGSTNSQA